MNRRNAIRNAIAAATASIAVGSGRTAHSLTTNQQATGASFYPITPCRVADTRKRPEWLDGVGWEWGYNWDDNPDGRTITVNVGRCVPAGAQSVFVTFTAIHHGGSRGNVRMWPTGEPMPHASMYNLPRDGITGATTVPVKLDANGRLNVHYANFDGAKWGGSTNFALDVSAYAK